MRTMQVVGSVITVTDGSLLQFTNNTNTGAGGTLYVLSLGQIIIGDGVTMIFSGNKGRYLLFVFCPPWVFSIMYVLFFSL